MATDPMLYGIVDGPSREELFDALRLRDEQGRRDPRKTSFSFHTPGGCGRTTVPCIVNGIVRDLGRGGNKYIVYLDVGGTFGSMRAIYDARSRTGEALQVLSDQRRFNVVKAIIRHARAIMEVGEDRGAINNLLAAANEVMTAQQEYDIERILRPFPTLNIEV